MNPIAYLRGSAIALSLILGLLPPVIAQTPPGNAPPSTPGAADLETHGPYAMPATLLRESPRERLALPLPSPESAPPAATPKPVASDTGLTAAASVSLFVAPLAAPLAPLASPEPDTQQVLNADDVLERSLSPRERIVLQQFAASLPRYREDPSRDGFFARATEFVFPTPIALRVGKVTVHGGIATAVKTGNPLGLLNPEFLGLSW